MAFGRVRLYHHSMPQGKVFDNAEDFNAHVATGWVDFPTKIIYPDAIVEAPKPVQVIEPEKVVIDAPKAIKKPGRPPKKDKKGK